MLELEYKYEKNWLFLSHVKLKAQLYMFKFHMDGRGELFSGQKIGTGYFRDCYSVENHKDICVKIIKPGLDWFRFFQLRFFRKNIHLEESETWQLLPEEIKNYFNPVIFAGKSYSVCPRPLNGDGSYAQSLRHHQGISDDRFWEEIGYVYRFIEERQLWFFDIFNGRNIFVVEKDKEVLSPLFVDYKQLGWKAFPLQPDLAFHFRKKQKLKRQYERLIRNYRKTKTYS